MENGITQEQYDNFTKALEEELFGEEPAAKR